MPKPYAQQSLVIFVKNKKRMSAFYRATLNLKAIEEEASHDLLRGPGIELVIHTIPPRYAKDIKITKPPRVREDTPLKPAFFVPNLARARDAAKAAGGLIKPDEFAWQIRGATVIDGWDPEGNVVQFKQMPPSKR